MSVRWALLAVGLCCTLLGAMVALFADRIQAYNLSYEPPAWQRPLWEMLKASLPMTGDLNLTMLRLAGVTGFVIGVLMMALALHLVR